MKLFLKFLNFDVNKKKNFLNFNLYLLINLLILLDLLHLLTFLLLRLINSCTIKQIISIIPLKLLI